MTNAVSLTDKEYLLPGNRSCPGCSMSLAYRYILKALEGQVIVTVPASCLTVLHGMYPVTSVMAPCVNTPFASIPKILFYLFDLPIGKGGATGQGQNAIFFQVAEVVIVNDLEGNPLFDEGLFHMGGQLGVFRMGEDLRGEAAEYGYIGDDVSITEQVAAALMKEANKGGQVG